ncbi:MAG: pimeloyl-ACP methyl esterase BioG family protein [candidate division FCPU426 bacterium]
MKSHWLFQQGRPELILFFNGWGMDPRPLGHLACREYDVLELHGYDARDLPASALAAWPRYGRIHVAAWSLGVWMAGAVRAQLPSHARLALAVNGTLRPVDGRYGIAPGIFQQTLESWSPEVRGQFYANCFDRPEEAERFSACAPERSVEDQQQELGWLWSGILRDPEPAAGFAAAFIGRRDLIFTARNQLRFWQDRCPHQAQTCGHFPFFAWSSWEDVLRLTWTKP